MARTWRGHVLFPLGIMDSLEAELAYAKQKFRVNFAHAWRNGTAEQWLDGARIVGDTGIVPKAVDDIAADVALPDDIDSEEAG
eukprot:gene16799-biopygen14355